MPKVIERKGHSFEREKVAAMVDIVPGAIHVGSTAIQLSLRDGHDGLISGRIAPTADVDIVLPQKDAEALARKHNAELRTEHMMFIDDIIPGTMEEVYRKQQVKEPFALQRLVSAYPLINGLFEKVDIFTEKTGIGPIPVTSAILEGGYHTVTVDKVGTVKVAMPFFLIATQMNPFAWTDSRVKRLIPLMFQTYDDNGPTEYRREIERALEYISYGHRNVVDALAVDPDLIRRTEVRNYDKRIININVQLRGLRQKILNMARLMKGVENGATERMKMVTAAADDMINITTNLFLSYYPTNLR